MYVRFVASRVDRDTHRREGLFQAAYELLDGDVMLEPEDRSALESTIDWFRKHLDAPKRHSNSRKPNAAPNAISWFRDSAGEHIQRMYELSAILGKYGVPCDVIRCERPGVIVYRDAFQIAAVPFRDTPT